MKSARKKHRSYLRRLGDDRGQAAIELMLVFPLFMFITLIAVEFGVWMYQSVNVANSVREAARYGAVNCGPESSGNCSDALIKQKAVDKSEGALDPTEISVGWVARAGAEAGEKGSSIVVRAEHTHNLIFALPVISTISLPIISCADMRLERNDSGSVTTPGPSCE